MKFKHTHKNDFFSSKTVNIALVTLSKVLINRPCGRSTVAFTSTITNIALMLTEAPERVLATQMGKVCRLN